MPRGLPAPLHREPPEVVVVETAPATAHRRGGSLARLALSVTPDVIEVVDRALAQRRLLAEQRAVTAAPIDNRSHTHAVQRSEVEINTWDPFPRRIKMTTTTQWVTSTPTPAQAAPTNDERGSALRRAGIGAVGALAIATLGVMANRNGVRLRR